MADTIVDHIDQQNNLDADFGLAQNRELLDRDVNPLLERKWYVYGVVMALLMWIVGVMRLTKNMPRRLAKANVYPDGVRVMPTQEYMAMAKKMADLEEKYDSVDAQAVVSREKEKVLDAALGCVDQLQLQLSETKKALDETMTRQHEMMALIEKKKKKKRKRKFLLKGCFGGVSSASSL
ncbi:hypothetical protein IGI04_025339 [Brassica rapa subsp. trilocularis]|uniref:Uncharacterized protein n=1 Tax=Brassica rapa subsp. trilocularis TaxID=1813537 RepID=A0ABQ7MD35_BRACM|nr:hypothetical protein IGI04_025339 [Brassica rapa subsp. trilocularis]